MLRAIDVASWFLTKESMTHKKIQKLCYYAQAWHFTLLNKPLFEDRIEAWVHGPVTPSIYPQFADFGWQSVPKLEFNSVKAEDETIELLDAVYKTYGKYTGDQLEYLTHREDPWIKARGELESWENCSEEITLQMMKEYYSKLYHNAQND